VDDALNTSAAKQRILARLRDARRSGDLPAAEEGRTLPISSLDKGTLPSWIERFASELKKLGVPFFQEATAAAVSTRVREWIGTDDCLAWSPEALPYDLGAVLSDLRVHGPGAERAVAAACPVGLTGVHAAIAETGSLVCISTPATPRTASLLPPRHVAVLRPEQLRPSMGSFLRDRADSYPDSSAVNFITGPSRTADIELQLTLGVHGPGEVVVIMGPAAHER
jgi:hypothetical protein